MRRANRIIHSKARMKYSLASRRPLQFFVLKAVGLGILTAVNFLSPSAPRVADSPLFGLLLKGPPAEWPLTVAFLCAWRD